MLKTWFGALSFELGSIVILAVIAARAINTLS